MKESRNVNQANGNALINAADISRHLSLIHIWRIVELSDGEIISDKTIA